MLRQNGIVDVKNPINKELIEFIQLHLALNVKVRRNK
jgi:hypothetical protein